MSDPHVATPVYKICSAEDWTRAERDGVYRGSEVDQRDGFIHLSTGPQLPETLRRHFEGQRDLVLVAFEPRDLGEGLRWEPSRGGELFPHFYGALPVSLARQVSALDDDRDWGDE
ncbi:MAG: DUF952 domain-containing protein [Myxococcales bacterium]|nr:DUF952 domain-containing protein [Myxococcales bacterium]